MLISGVKPRRTPGYRSLVVIENGPLATFLGDAENPSHTEWQKDNVRGDYSYHDSVLKYVTNCVSNILKRVNDHQKTADPTLLLDLFSLDGGDLNWHKKRQGAKPKPSLGENRPPEDIPEPKRPQYKVRKKSNGFVINRGHRDSEPPEALKILIAYGVRKGDAFRKYDPLEFDVSMNPISVSLTGGYLEECSKNLIRIHSLTPDFELAVFGFDTNRDLHISARIETTEGGADKEEVEVSDGDEA